MSDRELFKKIKRGRFWDMVYNHYKERHVS